MDRICDEHRTSLEKSTLRFQQITRDVVERRAPSATTTPGVDRNDSYSPHSFLLPANLDVRPRRALPEEKDEDDSPWPSWLG
ncbi:hypothetical protein [Rhodococcus sp. G-MC3]|uniref:hypothetical protein n=1 Tax=Rhodococcus sp. G-MC3 TaxID=3046209 RepID=UPI0024BA1182|nr:hypothetical protein [Rhodococcus sp. G-MC3]